MRWRHYSIHTERAYRHWDKRYVRFHNMQARDDSRDGEEKTEAFLTYLARHLQVAASTRNQAMNAVVFLYKHLLKQPPFWHRFTTHLLQRRTDIQTIQALLGHADVSTAMIYTHVLQQGGHGFIIPLDDLGIEY